MHTDQTNKWNISVKDVLVSICLKNGILQWSVDAGDPKMNIQKGNLGRISADGAPLEWVQVINTQTLEHPAGTDFSITLQDSENRFQLTRFVTVYANHPFVRSWGEVKNLQSRNAEIQECAIFDYSLLGSGQYSLFHVEQVSAHYRRDFFAQNELWLIAGRSPHEIRMGSFPSQYWAPTSCGWFAMRNGQWGGSEPLAKGAGLVCAPEFNGKSRVYAWADPGCAHVACTIDTLAHRLLPGGVFEIPGFFAGFFEGDWDEAGYMTQRFAEDHIHPPMPDHAYPWAQYNSWAFGQEINETQQLAVIDRCAELGLELVVLDLGWARTVGDWRPDPVKFPNGLKPLAERAKSYGIRFGVHVALAQCNTQAPIAQEHPEWLIHNEVDYFGAAPLCLGHKPCRDWLTEQLVNLVKKEGVEYILQDGEDMVKLCRRTDHTHAPLDSNYSNSQYGLDIVIQALRKACPQVVLENCEDGGCMMTYKMAAMYHTSITVDNIDTYSTRQGVYGASYVFSPRYSVRYMQDAPTKYTLFSSIFGGPLIFMHRITDWTSQEMEETKQAIVLYKELRQIIRSAKIIHLAAPKYNDIEGGWGWDAIQAVSQDKTQSVAMLYRAKGDAGQKTFVLGGLLANAEYSITYVASGITACHTGEYLMNTGLTVALEEYDAEIVKLNVK